MGIEQFFAARISAQGAQRFENTMPAPAKANMPGQAEADPQSRFLDLLFAKLDPSALSKKGTDQESTETTSILDTQTTPTEKPISFKGLSVGESKDGTFTKTDNAENTNPIPQAVLDAIAALKAELKQELEIETKDIVEQKVNAKLEAIFDLIDRKGFAMRGDESPEDGDPASLDGLESLLGIMNSLESAQEEKPFFLSGEGLIGDNEDDENAENTPSPFALAQGNGTDAFSTAGAGTPHQAGLFIPSSLIGKGQETAQAAQDLTKAGALPQTNENGSRFTNGKPENPASGLISGSEYSRQLQEKILGAPLEAQNGDVGKSGKALGLTEATDSIGKQGQTKDASTNQTGSFANLLDGLTILGTDLNGIGVQSFGSSTTESTGLNGFGHSAPTTLSTLSSHITNAPHAGHAHPATHMVALQIQKSAANGENRQLTLQLDPPELGRVEVKMDFGADKKMKTVLKVEKPETHLMLQRDAQTLERALQDMGIELDGNMEFTLAENSQDFMGDNRRGGGHDHTGAHGAGGASGSEEQGFIEATVNWNIDPETGHTRYDFWV